MAQPKQQAVAKTTTITHLAIQDLDLDAIIDAAKESSGIGFSAFDLEKITVPNGLAWAVQGRPRETLNVVILHYHRARMRYDGPYEQSQGSRPPLCASSDGVTGSGDPGGDCQTCFYAGFGEGCNPFVVLYGLFAESTLPVCIQIPRTSLRAGPQYVRSYLAMGPLKYGKPFFAYQTVIGLEQRQGGPGMLATFTKGPDLAPDVVAAVKTYREAFRASLQHPTRPQQGQLADPTAKRALPPAEYHICTPYCSEGLHYQNDAVGATHLVEVELEPGGRQRITMYDPHKVELEPDDVQY